MLSAYPSAKGTIKKTKNYGSEMYLFVYCLIGLKMVTCIIRILYWLFTLYVMLFNKSAMSSADHKAASCNHVVFILCSSVMWLIKPFCFLLTFNVCFLACGWTEAYPWTGLHSIAGHKQPFGVYNGPNMYVLGNGNVEARLKRWANSFWTFESSMLYTLLFKY